MNESCHFQYPNLSTHRGFVILLTSLINHEAPFVHKATFRIQRGCLGFPTAAYLRDLRPLSSSPLTFSCVSRALAALQESQEPRVIWDFQEFQGFKVRHKTMLLEDTFPCY